MSYLKHALGLADDCPHCDGAGELTIPVQVHTGSPFTPDGIEQDWHYEPCQACNGTGEAVDAPAILEQVAEEHQLITEQKERAQWMH